MGVDRYPRMIQGMARGWLKFIISLIQGIENFKIGMKGCGLVVEVLNT